MRCKPFPVLHRLFHAPTRTTSSGCFMQHRTVHALWNLYGNPYRNRAEMEETIPQDCFLPKGSYAYPSSVIIFMKWNLYRKVPLCLSKQHVWTYKLRKVYCFKRLWLERNYWIGLPLFINDDTHPFCSRYQVASLAVKQSTYVTTFRRFS